MNTLKSNQKVVHIMSSYGGGISSFIRNKAEVLKNDSVSFDLITFNEVPKEFNTLIEDTGGKVFKVSNPKKEGFNKFYSQVNSIMKRLPKDILIHSHVDGMIALPFYLIARKNGLKRFAVHAHTAAPSPNSSKIQEDIKRTINRMISKEKLSCGIKASGNIFGEKAMQSNSIVHIPNSIDYNAFKKEKDNQELKRQILGIEDNRLIIGSIARFRELKNHRFMIEVIEQLKEKDVNFLWFFAGDGLLKKEIEKLVNQKGLNEYVRFLGRRDDIPDLFRIMDIFALPSFYEGLPTVVIEAQATSTTSYVSDTVTRECDFDLGLVKFLTIQDSSVWAESIQRFTPKLVDAKIIDQKFLENKFTNETSADLYKQFLYNKLNHYNI